MKQGTFSCFEVDSAWPLAFRHCSRPQSLSQALHRVIHFGWLYSMGFKSRDSISIFSFAFAETPR